MNSKYARLNLSLAEAEVIKLVSLSANTSADVVIAVKPTALKVKPLVTVKSPAIVVRDDEPFPIVTSTSASTLPPVNTKPSSLPPS